MAHKQQKEFLDTVKQIFPYHFESQHTKVLEIGSRHVNGTCRELFATKNYIGLDLTEGKCVDVVCHARDYKCPDNTFDVVISCEALEHDEHWQDTLAAAYRLLVPGGLLIITCAGPMRGEHGTRRTTPTDSPATLDYYKNIAPSEIAAKFVGASFSRRLVLEGWGGKDTYFWGVKA